MVIQSQAELDQFHQFASQELAEHGPINNPELLLRQWLERQEHQAIIAAVNAGLADVAAGRTMDLHEADQYIRERLGLPRQAS